MKNETTADYPLTVDGQTFNQQKPRLCGLDIKVLSGTPGDHMLYLEETGREPDRIIADADFIDLTKRHFTVLYTTPRGMIHG